MRIISRSFVFGVHAEEIASVFLVAQGYTILTKRFKTRQGEIDLLATHQGKLVILEVKARKPRSFTTPEEAITFLKLICMLRCVHQIYLRFPQYKNLPLVIELIFIQGNTISAHLTDIQLT